MQRTSTVWLRYVATAVITVGLFGAANLRAEAQVFGYPTTSVVGNCAALSNTAFDSSMPNVPAQVITSQVVPAAGALPEYCDVVGYTDDSIKWELQP